MKKLAGIIAIMFGLGLAAQADNDWNQHLEHFQNTEEVMETPQGWEAPTQEESDWNILLEHFENTHEVIDNREGIATAHQTSTNWNRLLEHF